MNLREVSSSSLILIDIILIYITIWYPTNHWYDIRMWYIHTHTKISTHWYFIFSIYWEQSSQQLPPGKLTVCHFQFTQKKWWFSIAMLNYQRVCITILPITPVISCIYIYMYHIHGCISHYIWVNMSEYGVSIILYQLSQMYHYINHTNYIHYIIHIYIIYSHPLYHIPSISHLYTIYITSISHLYPIYLTIIRY